MRYPQVLVYEHDGSLALLLRRLAEGGEDARRPHWYVHEPRTPKACFQLLARGDPAVLVLKVGRDLESELALLERVSWLFPDAATVVVGEYENPVAATLAWDLGAAFVLAPPVLREMLPEIVVGLLQEPKRSAPLDVEAAHE
jgi:hypothetical protein